MMRQVRIVGVGMTPLGRLNRTLEDLSAEAVRKALADARLNMKDLDGIVALPSLSTSHFMPAQQIGTALGILPRKNFVCRSIDSGGAGPISALFTASALIKNEWANTVAIIGGDAVLSMGSKPFAEKADASMEGSGLPSPCIPNGYDLYARWHMQQYGTTREQLAMIPVIESHLAVKHPLSMCRKPLTLDEVLRSRPVAPVTNLLECARRADGAFCMILSSSNWYHKSQPSEIRKPEEFCPVVISAGEATGPLFPPKNMEDINEDYFSCERAAKVAYKTAQLSSADIDFFGLYDCFPICLLRALSSCRVCRKGEEGRYVEEVYNRLLKTGQVDTELWPVNTHGGLQCFGAPWEVPAAYSVVEAIAQLNGQAGDRQLWLPGEGRHGSAKKEGKQKPRRALVYGNGGIFSSSAVAILGSGDILHEETAGWRY